MASDVDRDHMLAALALSRTVRTRTAPNPWVGCRIVSADGTGIFEGVTAPPGGAHAEIEALGRAGAAARGATAYVTLEPCAHTGRTGPCADALVAAGIARVVIGLVDPDEHVRGAGVRRLTEGGAVVETGVCAGEVETVLSPYLTHRRTGRPLVVLKLAASLDGRIAAPDGSSRFITGAAARADVHRLRAESDAVLVGAGTVRRDDPELTVRDSEGCSPLRVVLGKIPPGARVAPALSLCGGLDSVLDELGRRGVLQLLVEGGAHVASDFHRGGLVDRYVVYVAPVLFGGDDALAMFVGTGAARIDDVFRGRLISLERLGEDVRIELAPRRDGHTEGDRAEGDSAREGDRPR